MAKKKKEPEHRNAFDVWLDGELIDTVFFYGNHDIDSVRRSLVYHDGYDQTIEVTEHGT